MATLTDQGINQVPGRRSKLLNLELVLKRTEIQGRYEGWCNAKYLCGFRSCFILERRGARDRPQIRLSVLFDKILDSVPPPKLVQIEQLNFK
jgi:hypothetical protein